MYYITLNLLKSSHKVANVVQRDEFLKLKFGFKRDFNQTKSARFPDAGFTTIFNYLKSNFLQVKILNRWD
jgi:hypothetical protein